TPSRRSLSSRSADGSSSSQERSTGTRFSGGPVRNSSTSGRSGTAAFSRLTRKGFAFPPSPSGSGGEGLGVRGEARAGAVVPPHPRPLSPEGGGEGRRVLRLLPRLSPHAQPPEHRGGDAQVQQQRPDQMADAFARGDPQRPADRLQFRRPGVEQLAADRRA